MSRVVQRLAWLPPFAVGLSAAVAGELSAGLLLYATPGFIRALTLILAVLLGSLSLGLWTAPGPDSPTLTDSLRRRWMLALIAFAAASAVAAGWSVQGGLDEGMVRRGVGLALLAALPLYASGALLGAMSSARSYRGRSSFVGASGVAGATLGIALAGWVLVAVLAPVSMYAFCLVLLSGGALVHGWVLAAQGERRTLHTAASPYGPVEVRDRSWGKDRRERVLLENGRVRGAETPAGEPARPWEVAALELLHQLTFQGMEGGPGTPTAEPTFEAAASPSRSVLVLGAGALTLPRRLLTASPEWSAHAVERSAQVLGAAAEHFGATDQLHGLQVTRGEPLGASGGAASEPAVYDAIVVDAAGLGSSDPVPPLGAATLEALRGRLAPHGLLIVGGLTGDAALGAPIEALVREALPVFPAVGVYRRRAAGLSAPGSVADGESLLVVLSPDRERALAPTAGDLALRSLERAELPEAVVEPADVGATDVGASTPESTDLRGLG